MSHVVFCCLMMNFCLSWMWTVFLDGDLEKVSSLEIDMRDLDISYPLKRSGIGERSKEECGDGNIQEQQVTLTSNLILMRICCCFLGSRLDNFQIGPSSMDEGNKVSTIERVKKCRMKESAKALKGQTLSREILLVHLILYIQTIQHPLLEQRDTVRAFDTVANTLENLQPVRNPANQHKSKSKKLFSKKREPSRNHMLRKVFRTYLLNLHLDSGE